MYEFGEKYCDFARVEDWKEEMILSAIRNRNDDMETFRDRADYSDIVSQVPAEMVQLICSSSCCCCTSSSCTSHG